MFFSVSTTSVSCCNTPCYVRVQVLSLVAHCYEMDGRYEEALAYRQRVVQLDPQNFRAKRELSQLKQQMVKETGDDIGAARLRRAGTVI